MVISPKLYVSESLTKKKDKVIRKILHNRKVLNLFVITGASNAENLLDIYYYNELFQKFYRNYYDLTIYGIAKTREEAFALIEQMTQDCIREQNNCDLRVYLKLPKNHSMGG